MKVEERQALERVLIESERVRRESQALRELVAQLTGVPVNPSKVLSPDETSRGGILRAPLQDLFDLR
ncbi:hypothetical protein OP10G_2611 [Fimbriimonas ginsengisoli Gsoil 348]|uniref:Uncharacterized protein n=1 Tax=Fimbriimonas ginsengisoli Gsoil 348 TaxID=661478 RepID=A0A068NWK8_FIMGI|nr:hypothetical protein OP10G_2611 [Fimbriimonas ginsengisoli Gsoil 348]